MRVFYGIYVWLCEVLWVGSRIVCNLYEAGLLAATCRQLMTAEISMGSPNILVRVAALFIA